MKYTRTYRIDLGWGFFEKPLQPLFLMLECCLNRLPSAMQQLAKRDSVWEPEPQWKYIGGNSRITFQFDSISSLERAT